MVRRYAAEWGEANGVGVTVDHVNFTELFSTLAAEIDAGAGHTIVEVLFSPASFIDGLHDLRDINEAAAAAHGERTGTCHAASYLPINDTYYAYTHGYVPDPGDYDIALWTEAGYPDGPKTYDDLLEGGRAIYEATGIPVGIGMSPELDSRMANRAAIWSFGGSIQDEDENVVLNSEETIAAVKYLAQLQNEAMTDEVFGWTAASNNQALIAGEVSYILNSNSAYRSLQKIDEAAQPTLVSRPRSPDRPALGHRRMSGKSMSFPNTSKAMSWPLPSNSSLTTPRITAKPPITANSIISPATPAR